MGKHSIKKRIWEKINNQNEHGIFPAWVGWLIIGIILALIFFGR